MKTLINVLQEESWLKEHRFIYGMSEYSYPFIKTKYWIVCVKEIDRENWYECYYKPSDNLASDYDYSSRDLREVLEYMNSCTGDVIYY